MLTNITQLQKAGKLIVGFTKNNGDYYNALERKPWLKRQSIRLRLCTVKYWHRSNWVAIEIDERD